MKLRVADADGPALDWMVAVALTNQGKASPGDWSVCTLASAQGSGPPHVRRVRVDPQGEYMARSLYWSPSKEYAQGGPIVDPTRERLRDALRRYAAKHADEVVEVPDELCASTGHFAG